MKIRLLVFFSILTVSSSFSQDVVSSQGDSYSNSTANIDYTIGEVAINTGTNGTYDITQGFHQTNWNYAGIEDFSPDYSASVYPNPTSEILNIRVTVFENVTYALYDAVGKLLLQGKISGEMTELNVGQLPSGNYSLTLKNENQNLKTFKLIKNQ